MHRSPFDRLRANGGKLENVEDFPFVLSLSKHEHHFFSNLSGFVTILVLACCLVLGGFAAPASAKTIVVNTLTDTADPPFNADGACGTGTVRDLPGADGLISLREAIIAANNTNGEQTITFDPSLSGDTIVVNFDDLDLDAALDPLPALCGGHTRIEGDLNGDDVPDVILEGAAFPAASAAAGILILSSHNMITGLQVQHFPFGIRILAGDLTNPGTVTHTTVTNNILADSKSDGIFAATGNVPGSLVAHATLTQNLVMNNARVGILVVASLSAAGSDTQLNHTTVTDNEVMGNGQLGIFLLSLGDHNAFCKAPANAVDTERSALALANTNQSFGWRFGRCVPGMVSAISFPTYCSPGLLMLS